MYRVELIPKTSTLKDIIGPWVDSGRADNSSDGVFVFENAESCAVAEGAFREGRDSDDERHICPLQLDVIERCIQLWSNPGETVWTPFMGIGSEVYMAVKLGRRGIGVELKPSYYQLAVKNIEQASKTQYEMFAA